LLFAPALQNLHIPLTPLGDRILPLSKSKPKTLAVMEDSMTRAPRLLLLFVFSWMAFNSTFAQQRQTVQLAGLQPSRQLVLQRVSPSPEKPDGPVLYQLLFNASGTPGTVPVFDTNPRHLVNSDIKDAGGIVSIGGSGFTINAGTGIVTFANGQTFPGTGTVTSVGNTDNFLTVTSPSTTPVVNLNTATTDARYLQLKGGTLTGPLNGTAATFSGPTSFGGDLTVGSSGGNVIVKNAVAVFAPNNGLGTTLNELAEINAAGNGTVNTAGTSNSVGTIGIVIAGAGTSGNAPLATLAVTGTVPCSFDGPATAADYVIKSTTTGGMCSDTGTNYPTSVQVVGRVLSSTGACTPPNCSSLVALYPGEQRAAAGTIAGVTSVSATYPLSVTNPTTTPNIALTGTVSVGNGGTGLASTGAPGSFLRSDGANWNSSAIQRGDIAGGYVDLTTPQTVGGTKTFTDTITAAPNPGAAAPPRDGGDFTGSNTDPGGNGVVGTAGGSSSFPPRGLGGNGGVFQGGYPNGVGVVASGGGYGIAGLVSPPRAGDGGQFQGGGATPPAMAGNGIVATSGGIGGIAGIFNNPGGGQILSGRNNGTEKFSVGGNGNTAIGGTLAMGGLVTFANGQTFPGTGTVASVSNTDGFLSIATPTTTPVINLNTPNTDARYVLKAGDTMTGPLVLLANGLTVGTTQLVAANGGVGIGTSAPESIAEIRQDAGGALGATLSISNFGGSASAATAIDFRTYSNATPAARIEAVDDGNFSNNLLFLNKVPGNNGNNALQRNLVIDSVGSVVVDPSGSNTGKNPLDNPPANVLLFGDTTSGEGIGSQRAFGANQFGLDFYTGYFSRLRIFNNGKVEVTGDLQVDGTLSTPSDRNIKTAFASIQPMQVLRNLLSIPIQSWQYKTDTRQTRHIGPMAQDFFAAFAVGADDHYITTVDEGGVALAAIQGLNQKLEEQLHEKDVQIAALQQQMSEMMRRLKALENRR
jgi:hypothetical protein